jgi:hypothetical protein
MVQETTYTAMARVAFGFLPETKLPTRRTSDLAAVLRLTDRWAGTFNPPDLEKSGRGSF